jgi:hypothetical protein
MSTEHKITCMTDGKSWQWVRDDGRPMSPKLDTLDEARKYPHTHSFRDPDSAHQIHPPPPPAK